MGFKLEELSKGEKTIIISGIVALITLFLPWRDFGLLGDVKGISDYAWLPFILGWGLSLYMVFQKKMIKATFCLGGTVDLRKIIMGSRRMGPTIFIEPIKNIYFPESMGCMKNVQPILPAHNALRDIPPLAPVLLVGVKRQFRVLRQVLNALLQNTTASASSRPSGGECVMRLTTYINIL